MWKPLIFGVVLATSTTAGAYTCSDLNNLTYDQKRLLHYSYAVGNEDGDDMGQTLSAIVWRESFVGDHIIRNNPKDGNYGSYGVTHVKMETAMELLGVDNVWEARAWVFESLVNDGTDFPDTFALNTAKLKLRSTKSKIDSHGFEYWRMTYNGNNPEYGRDVTARVKIMSKCGFFEY